jgi:hypothetical protein
VAVLCTGSVAVDHIMVYHGRFRDVILPDRIHMLNVAFHVPQLRRSFGGCAANIAYHLRLLGDDPIVLAPWAARLRASPPGSPCINRDHIVGPAGIPSACHHRPRGQPISASTRARWTEPTRPASSG